MLDEQVVRLAEVGQLRVLLERQYQVATVDLGARVQASDRFLETPRNREASSSAWVTSLWV